MGVGQQGQHAGWFLVACEAGAVHKWHLAGACDCVQPLQVAVGDHCVPLCHRLPVSFCAISADAIDVICCAVCCVLWCQVGKDEEARQFLENLDKDPQVGNSIDCTSYYELEQVRGLLCRLQE